MEQLNTRLNHLTQLPANNLKCFLRTHLRRGTEDAPGHRLYGDVAWIRFFRFCKNLWSDFFIERVLFGLQAWYGCRLDHEGGSGPLGFLAHFSSISPLARCKMVRAYIDPKKSQLTRNEFENVNQRRFRDLRRRILLDYPNEMKASLGRSWPDVREVLGSFIVTCPMCEFRSHWRDRIKVTPPGLGPGWLGGWVGAWVCVRCGGWRKARVNADFCSGPSIGHNFSPHVLNFFPRA